MIDEREIREMLDRRARSITAIPTQPAKAVRKARRRVTATSLLGAALIIAVSVATIGSIRALEDPPEPVIQPTPSETQSVDEPADPFAIVIPPEAAEPSSPSVGELVVGFEAEEVEAVDGQSDATLTITNVFVYADGRAIWYRATCRVSGGCEPLVVTEDGDEPSTGWIEQRLTPAGLESLRSELVATGLFERDLSIEMSDQDIDEWDLVNWSSFDVQNGSRLVEVSAQSPGFIAESGRPSQLAALKQAQDLLLDLSWIPGSEWEDRTIRSFVPSRYCAWFSPGAPPEAAELPPPADELIGGQAFTVLTTEEARAVDASFVAAGIQPGTGDGFFWTDLTYRVVRSPGGHTTTMHLGASLPHAGTCR